MTVSLLLLLVMVAWYQMTDLSEDPSHEVFKIYSLSGDQLVEFLEENGFSSEVCQIFTGIVYL